MTTQEAKIKNDIPRKSQHTTYNELYFPDLRSTIFSLFTGDKDLVFKILKEQTECLQNLKSQYDAVIEAEHLPTNSPIQIEFTDNGIELLVIQKQYHDGESRPQINLITYLVLSWYDDVEVLTMLAKTMNEIMLQCTRLIPTLINQRKNFKTVSTIESNPIYEYMVFTYSMYKMLKMDDSLPGCYVQTLMARKRITYNMLCHTLKYSTNLPESVTNWFSKENIVKKQSYILMNKQSDKKYNLENQNKDDEEVQNEEPNAISQWALHLIDYTGQKFSQRLQLQLAPKKIFENDRCIIIDGDLSITG
jgi:hypothetical protein